MDINERFSRAYKLMCEEHYTEALNDFNTILEEDEDYISAYAHRAHCRGRLKDYNGAIEDLKIAMKEDPSDPMTFYNLGSLLYYTGVDTKETGYFSTVLAMDSSDRFKDVYAMRGAIYYKNGFYKLALDDYTKAIELEYSPRECYAKRAECYRELSDYDNALKDYTKVLELDSESTDEHACNAYGGIGYVKQIKREFEEAMKYYKKMKEIDSSKSFYNDCIEMCEEALQEKSVAQQ